jgi:hypothetical protein
VVELQGHVGLVAVDTAVPKLRQHVLPPLVGGELPFLLLDSRNLSILHQLGIEFDQFLAAHRDGTKVLQALHPAEGVLDATLQRRREPASPSSTVLEACLTVPGLTLPPHSTAGPTIEPPRGNGVALVGQCRFHWLER